MLLNLYWGKLWNMKKIWREKFTVTFQTLWNEERVNNTNERKLSKKNHKKMRIILIKVWGEQKLMNVKRKRKARKERSNEIYERKNDSYKVGWRVDHIKLELAVIGVHQHLVPLIIRHIRRRPILVSFSQADIQFSSKVLWCRERETKKKSK